MASCFFVRSAWAAFQGFRCLAREFPCKLRNRRTGRGFEGYLSTTCCDDGLQSEWQRSILMPSSSHWFPQNVPMNLYLMQAQIAIGGPHRWQVGQKPCSEISCQIPNLLSAKLCRENFVSIRRNTSCFDCYILWFFVISACFPDCFCCTRIDVFRPASHLRYGDATELVRQICCGVFHFSVSVARYASRMSRVSWRLVEFGLSLHTC